MNTAAKLAESLLHSQAGSPAASNVHTERNTGESVKTMRALVWQGAESVQVQTVSRPTIVDPTDAVIKVTATTICGSDLHLYHKAVPEMKAGDILGHEFLGIVKEIGPAVENLKIGDRVVVSFCICCGKCAYCRREEFTACDTTNDSKVMEAMYGHRCAGMFGYSHLTGGYSGGQAEYVRVPYADFNTMHLPLSITDESALMLSDVACTAWHATELGNVTKGQSVVIWGAGPIGLLAAMWCVYKEAGRVVVIDRVKTRLNKVHQKFGGKVLTVNYEDPDTSDILGCIKRLVPGGPDVAIDAVGFRYTKTMAHKVETMLMLETDSIDALTEAIISVRKYGTVSIVGDYVGYVNHFPIGAVMEKGLTLRAGQTPVQKYWKKLLEIIKSDKSWDPAFIITHKFILEDTAKAYRSFDHKEDGFIKAFIRPENLMENEIVSALRSLSINAAESEE